MVRISPKIIHAVIMGDYPKPLTLATLKRKLPDLWSAFGHSSLGIFSHKPFRYSFPSNNRVKMMEVYYIYLSNVKTIIELA